MIALLTILMLLSGRNIFMPKLILTYIVFVTVQFVLFPLLPKIVVMLLSMFVVNVRKFFPAVIAIVIIYKTTRVSQLTATLHKMHVPKNGSTTVAIAIRYIPSLMEEWRHIIDEMRIRQVNYGIKNPFVRVSSSFECVLVPLFMSAIKTSDGLSAAAVCRGIENPEPPSCRSYRKMRMCDYVLTFFSISVLAMGIYMHYGIQ